MKVGRSVLAAVVGMATIFLVASASQAEITVENIPFIQSRSVQGCDLRTLIEEDLSLQPKKHEGIDKIWYELESRVLDGDRFAIKIKNCFLDNASKEEWRHRNADGLIQPYSRYEFFVAEYHGVMVNVGQSSEGLKQILYINVSITLNLYDSGLDLKDLKEELYQTLGPISLEGTARMSSYGHGEYDNRLFPKKPGDIRDLEIYITPETFILNGRKLR